MSTQMMAAVLAGFNKSQDRFRDIQAAKHDRRQKDELFDLEKKKADLEIKAMETKGEWSKMVGDMARQQLKEKTKLYEAKQTLDTAAVSEAEALEKDRMKTLGTTAVKLALTGGSTPGNYNGTVTIPGVGQAPFNNVPGPMQFTTADNPADPIQEAFGGVAAAPAPQAKGKVVNDVFAEPVPYKTDLTSAEPKLVKPDRKEYYLDRIQEIEASGERELTPRELAFRDKELGTGENMQQAREEHKLKQQQFMNGTRIRQEFIKRPEIQDYVTVATNVDAMEALYQKAQSGDIRNMVGVDQGLITMFNKLTDPQSVVRESEYARTPGNLPLVNRMVGAIDKLKAGGAGLTNDDREALLLAAKVIANERGETYQRTLDEYKDLATEYDIPEKLITRGMPDYKRYDVGKQAPAEAGTKAMPTKDEIKQAREEGYTGYNTETGEWVK